MNIAIPRRFVLVLTVTVAAHAVIAGVLHLVDEPDGILTVPALALVVAAFLLLVVGGPDRRSGARVTAVATTAAVLLPLLGAAGLDPATASFTAGGWYVEAIGVLVILLLWRHRESAAWVVMGALVLHTALWGGLQALTAFAVFAAVLLVGIVTAGGWALRQTAGVLAEHAEAEQRQAAFQAAQDAYHSERQVRLATTARLGDGMLARIVDRAGVLDAADRAECSVLHSTIRDEIRGRGLLNDALREQVLAHRRRGAVVQVNDDGGLDDLDPATVDAMVTRVAGALRGLTTDRVVIRTLPADSPKAISVVATSADPIAAALGLDDGDDRVDLWLELDRPAVAVGR